MKFYFYTTILVGILMLFVAFGFTDLPVSGGIAKTFKLVDDSGNITLEEFKSSPLYSGDSDSVGSFGSLQLVLGGLAIASLVIGIFGRSPDIAYIKAAIVFALSGFIVADYIALYLYAASLGIAWIKWGFALIFGVLLTGFFISTIEFWGGND